MGKSNLNEYYKQQLAKGIFYQDFVVEQLYRIGLPIINYSSKEYQYLIGENKAGIEIKFDDKYKITGNIYIETAEKSDKKNKEYVKSGIYRSDNTWLYVIGDFTTIFIFSKKHLQLLDQLNKKLQRVETKTSRGILLPVDKIKNMFAIKIIEVVHQAPIT